MSTWSLEDSTGIRWATLSRGRLARRALVLGSAVLAVACLRLADPSTPVWPGLVVLLWALAAAAVPDSPHGLLALATYGAWWLVSDPPESSPWSLGAALCVLVFHAATAAAASGPPGLVTDPATLRRWLHDLALVAVVTAAVWGVVAGFHQRVHSAEVQVGAALLLVVGLVWLTRGHSVPDTADAPGR